jgi:hypothetical protein
MEKIRRLLSGEQEPHKQNDAERVYEQQSEGLLLLL